LRAMAEARAAGDPERAAAIGREGLAVLPRDAALAVAAADALRARAREREGLALLADVNTREAAALRAELARLLGDADRARAEAERALAWGPCAPARATLARLALAEGDAERALSLAGHDHDGELATGGAERASEARDDAASSARLAEVRAFAELALG